MAYKQPYKQVNKDNDGASVVPFLAAIPALVAKIGTALKIVVQLLKLLQLQLK